MADQPNITTISLIVPKNSVRRWHLRIADQLRAAGFAPRFQTRRSEPPTPLLNTVLALEAQLFFKGAHRLSAPATLPKPQNTTSDDPPQLVVDLTGAEATGSDHLSLRFSSGLGLGALAAAIARGNLPDIALTDGTKTIASARPMIDDRTITIRAIEDVLARAVTLVVSTLTKLNKNRALPPADPVEPIAEARGFITTYITRSLPKLAKEILRRRSYHYAHWRTGFRFNSSNDVASSGDLSGAPWQVLPDDGTRFYADPFAFSHEGKHYIFVEDYPHQTGKAILSVAEIKPDGTPTKPQPIIEEDWHLSYPQVFAHNGEIWMLPEASTSNKLTLYRATDFPYRWEPHLVLIDKCQLSDATLVAHDNNLYLFATDTGGIGSTSDTMVVYCADQLTGPWHPHPQNPICIDRTKARPGGACINHHGKLLLPVQNGTLGYGGGLGFLEITSLSPTRICLGALQPANVEGAWPYPRIHTYNRCAHLEVIDGIAEVKKA